MIISRTPFRISFFGGGTDYPAWYANNGGSVLATTIDKYCYLTCRYLPPFFEHKMHVVHSKIENCNSIADIEHPAAREVLRYLNMDRGVSILHDGDLPARSGMGSSSSFTVGLLHATHALMGDMISKQQLAEEGIHIEQNMLKETVGSQDQIMAAHGGFNRISFSSGDQIRITPMTLPRKRIEELLAHLMLFYTGIIRNASDVAGSYVEKIEEKTSQLATIGSMVDEAVSILSGTGDITSFGRLLDESWRTKRTLSASVSNPHVEEIYEQGLSAGAIGGKLLGAGGGGFMLLFAPPGAHGRIRERLNRLIYVPFKFESSGSQIIFYDLEADYSAEAQVRAGQPIEAFRELDTIASGE